MEEPRSGFNISLERAERALVEAREKNKAISNPLLRMAHKGVVVYRQLDAVVVRDLAGKPEPIEEPRVDYAET